MSIWIKGKKKHFSNYDGKKCDNKFELGSGESKIWENSREPLGEGREG